MSNTIYFRGFTITFPPIFSPSRLVFPVSFAPLAIFFLILSCRLTFDELRALKKPARAN